MVYRFGDFTLDVDARQLLRGSEDLHLTPKAFDLLRLLIENRDRALSKAELQQRIWPSTFVEETNLATLIAEIRRGLGDSASHPAFVRTVYGFGYRFVGPVRDGVQGGERGFRLWLVLDRREIPLMDGENVVGRAPDAAIHIDAPSISRHHARVVVTDGEAILEDSGSKNGTALNGHPIAGPTPLRDGDEIVLGALRLTFRAGAGAAPTETLP